MLSYVTQKIHRIFNILKSSNIVKKLNLIIQMGGWGFGVKIFVSSL